MSFVDLMSDHRWSEVEIVNRTEAMVRQHFSVTAERILARKVMGIGLGFPLKPEDQAELQQFTAVTLTAQNAGNEAREMAALLARVLDAEQGVAPLAEDDTIAQELLSTRALARQVPEPQPEVDSE